MRVIKHTTDRLTLLLLVAMVTALSIMGVPFIDSVHAEGVSARYARISNATPSELARYDVGFTHTNTGVPVGSVRLQFCGNSPLLTEPCTAPSGMDVSATVLANQSGEVGYTIGSIPTNNEIILTRPATLPSGVAAEYELQSILNPNSSGTYYMRIETFTSTDATGLAIESGGVALSATPGLNVATEVPPYLMFCAAIAITSDDCDTAANYVLDFGEFSPSQTASGSSNVVVGTNAANGMSVVLSGTTLTSGNNVVPGLETGDRSKRGTSQFGINLVDNNDPDVGVNSSAPAATVGTGYNQSNIFRFQSGETIVSSVGPTGTSTFTISYMANISSAQPAGYYATTITYICLANF